MAKLTKAGIQMTDSQLSSEDLDQYLDVPDTDGLDPATEKVNKIKEFYKLLDKTSKCITPGYFRDVNELFDHQGNRMEYPEFEDSSFDDNFSLLNLMPVIKQFHSKLDADPIEISYEHAEDENGDTFSAIYFPKSLEGAHYAYLEGDLHEAILHLAEDCPVAISVALTAVTSIFCGKISTMIDFFDTVHEGKVKRFVGNEAVIKAAEFKVIEAAAQTEVTTLEDHKLLEKLHTSIIPRSQVENPC